MHFNHDSLPKPLQVKEALGINIRYVIGFGMSSTGTMYGKWPQAPKYLVNKVRVLLVL